MTNIDKYNQIFTEVFGVTTSLLNDDFGKETVDQWDSVHQLNLVSLAEEAFDIMLDPEDIMGFTSYAKGKEILMNQDIDLNA